MKKLVKISIWVIAIFFVCFIGASIIVALFGKSFCQSQIEKTLNRKAHIGSISLGLPVKVTLRDFEIENFAKIDFLSVSPNLLGFFAGKIILNQLTLERPRISVEMAKDGTLDIPIPAQKGPSPQVLIAGLRIKEGSVVFVDKKITPEGFKVNVQNINVDVTKNQFPPTSLYFRFNLSADLTDAQNNRKGQAQGSGWIDLGPKNMEGRIELKDIEIAFLEPYYRALISDKKLQSGKLNFVSDLKAERDDLLAKCHLEVADITYVAQPQEGSAEVDVTQAMLSVFSDSARKIVFDFPIRTKLSNPRFDLSSFKASIGQAAVQNIVNQPPEQLMEKGKEIGEQFEDIGKAFKGMFKKETE